MPTVVGIAFPWGRFHATPWGRHVNEAAVEWPPSPWRLLRGLYATWQARAPHLDEPVVHSLLQALAQPPAFQLPDHLEATTRHYLPDEKYGTDRVIDAFVVTARNAELFMRWDVDLTGEQRSALSTMLDALPFLGRAESVCEARLIDDVDLDGPWVHPSDGDGDGGVRVLTPNSPLQVNELCIRTQDMRKKGLLVPPGARWVTYPNPASFHETSTRHVRVAVQPNAVRWALSTTAQPGVRSAVVMADVLRNAAMSRYGAKNAGSTSSLLAGKDAEGRPLKSHGHAHYLVFDEDGDGLLDHAVVWARGGFDDKTLRALLDVRRLDGHQHLRDFRPATLGLEAVGDLQTVAPFLCRASRVWESHTPFAASRHGRKNEAVESFLQREVIAELRYRGIEAEVQATEVLPSRDGLSYRRHRIREHLQDARSAVGIRITFEEPIVGPLALGALSHFSLGLFKPVDE